MGVKLTYCCYKGQAGLDDLYQEWASLAEVKATHFLHFPGWYSAELARRGCDKNIFFIAARAQDKLVAILPFELIQQPIFLFKLPLLQLFYTNEMGVNDIFSVIELVEYFDEITLFMRRELPFFILVKWQCVLSDGVAASLGAAFRLSHSSKYLDLSSGVDAFWERYSSKFIKGLSKKRRKAEASGSLRLDVVTEPARLGAAFDAFLALENSGWKGAEGTSILKQPAKMQYYKSLLESYGGSGCCQINLLWLNDSPIAAQFAIVANRTLYLLKIGFDEAFSDVSPGYLILERLIEAQKESGLINKISFVTGVNWIDRWKPLDQPVGVFYSSNGSWWGRATIGVIYSGVMQGVLARRR